MATWKKIITSGSAAELTSLTLDTALPVGQGGTGVTTLTDGGILLGSGTGAITATAVLTDGQMLVGDGSTDPAIESGATLRTSIGVGTGDNVQFTNITGTGNTALGNAAADTHTFVGHITASGYKVSASAFIGDGSGLTGVGTDIDTLSDYGAQTIAQTDDHFLISDDGTEKKITFSDLEDSIFANVSGDATIAGGGALTIAADSVENSMLANMTQGTIKVGGGSNAPTDLNAKTDGQILVGDGTDINSVAVSGDIALANDGAVTIQADSVENSMLANITRGSVKVGGTSNAPTDLVAKASGQILVGDGTDIASVAVSGDMTLAANGALTIDNNAVDNDAIDNTADVTLQSLTLTGDLTVNGSTTSISSTNTEVADQFMFLASGSAASNLDAGIIVQSGSAHNSGSAFYHDKSDERWSVAKSVAKSHQGAAQGPTQFVTTVKTEAVNPDTTSGSYGAGEMHVNTTSGEIWIRFG